MWFFDVVVVVVVVVHFTEEDRKEMSGAQKMIFHFVLFFMGVYNLATPPILKLKTLEKPLKIYTVLFKYCHLLIY